MSGGPRAAAARSGRPTARARRSRHIRLFPPSSAVRPRCRGRTCSLLQRRARPRRGRLAEMARQSSRIRCLPSSAVRPRCRGRMCGRPRRRRCLAARTQRPRRARRGAEGPVYRVWGRWARKGGNKRQPEAYKEAATLELAHPARRRHSAASSWVEGIAAQRSRCCQLETGPSRDRSVSGGWTWGMLPGEGGGASPAQPLREEQGNSRRV